MAFRIAELYAEFRARGLARLSTSMKTLRVGLAQTSVAMTRLAAHIKIASIASVAMLGVGVWQAMKFEKQMAMVSTMLDEVSMKRMPEFAKGIRGLAVGFGDSTETLAKGMYDILSASIAPEKAMNVLTIATKAAVGGFTTTAVAADALTTILNSYGLATEQVGMLSDKMFATVKRGKLTYEELSSSIGKAAATAAIAGLSLDELLASIATITRAGIKSDQAMTSVVGVIRSFMKPSTEGARAAKALGFELGTATLKAEGLAGVLKRLNGLTAEQLATIFPNIRGLKGIAAAMQDQEGFAYDLALMTKSGGLAQEAFAKAANTTSFQLGKLKEGMLGVLRTAGDELLPTIRMVADAMSKVAKDPAFVGMLAKIVVKAGLAGAALLALGAAIKVLIPAVLLLKGTVIAAFAVLGILTSPIGLVVAALIGLGAYLLWTSGVGGKALAWLGEKFGELKDHALTAFAGISDALAAGDITLAAKVLWAGLKLLWQSGTNDLEKFWLDQKQSFLNTWTDIYYEFVGIWTKMQAHVEKIWAEMMDLFETAGVVAKGVWKLKAHERGRGAAEAELRGRRARGEIGEADYLVEAFELKQRMDAEWLKIVGDTEVALVGGAEDLKNKLLAIEAEKNTALRKNAVDAAKARLMHAIIANEDRAEAEKELYDAQLALITAREDAAEARWRTGQPAAAGGPPGAPGVPGGPEAPGLPKITAVLDRGSWSGLADVWKNVQAGILKVDPALAEAKKQTGLLGQIAGNTEDMGGGGAVVAAGGT